MRQTETENRIKWETAVGMGQETRFKSYSSKLTTKRKIYKNLTKKSEILS